MKDAPQQEQMGHTREQLAGILEAMEGISAVFYTMAQAMNFHQFLEFNGFIRQYIVCCREALAKGIDFTSERLPMVDHQAAYIGEKFGCIFEGSFGRQPDLIRAFCKEAFGVEVRVKGP